MRVLAREMTGLALLIRTFRCDSETARPRPTFRLGQRFHASFPFLAPALLLLTGCARPDAIRSVIEHA